jgi:hypothetical protein
LPLQQQQAITTAKSKTKIGKAKYSTLTKKVAKIDL